MVFGEGCWVAGAVGGGEFEVECGIALADGSKGYYAGLLYLLIGHTRCVVLVGAADERQTVEKGFGFLLIPTQGVRLHSGYIVGYLLCVCVKQFLQRPDGDGYDIQQQALDGNARESGVEVVAHGEAVLVGEIGVLHERRGEF